MRPRIMRLFVFLLPALCLAQAPKIGIIDFYGVRTVNTAELRKALGAKEGESLPASKGEIEERLESVPNVVNARLEAACCADGNAILYVGIEEKGSPHFNLREEPTEELPAPEPVVKAYMEFLDTVRNAGREGQTSEDLSQGHSLLADPKARFIQMGFIGLAEEHKETLQKVLRNSSGPEHRAIAAYVLGYVKDKASVQDDLQYALRDPDDTVRANALRALAAFAVHAQKHPDSGLKVAGTWLVEMLHSIAWTDRNNATVALVTVTESRDPSLIDHLRQRAMPALIEMARWKHLPHALPAFILVGRVAGLPENVIQDAWNKEQREAVIKKAMAAAKRK